MSNERSHNGDIDGRQFFMEVIKHKYVIIGVVLSCTMVASVYAFFKPVEYKSEAAICLRNPGITGDSENLQTIMLLKQNGSLSDIDLSYHKGASYITVEAKKKTAQEAHDAVTNAIKTISQNISEINEEKSNEEYPSLDFAQKEMILAKEKYQQAQTSMLEQSAEYHQLKDDYELKTRAYERQLDRKAQMLYSVKIIAEPNYPNKPYKAKRENNILVGFLTGCLFSFFFCLKQYRKKE